MTLPPKTQKMPTLGSASSFLCPSCIALALRHEHAARHGATALNGSTSGRCLGKPGSRLTAGMLYRASCRCPPTRILDNPNAPCLCIAGICPYHDKRYIVLP